MILFFAVINAIGRTQRDWCSLRIRRLLRICRFEWFGNTPTEAEGRLVLWHRNWAWWNAQGVQSGCDSGVRTVCDQPLKRGFVHHSIGIPLQLLHNCKLLLLVFKLALANGYYFLKKGDDLLWMGSRDQKDHLVEHIGLKCG